MMRRRRRKVMVIMICNSVYNNDDLLRRGRVSEQGCQSCAVSPSSRARSEGHEPMLWLSLGWMPWAASEGASPADGPGQGIWGTGGGPHSDRPQHKKRKTLVSACKCAPIYGKGRAA
eukprot:scaffold18464_cov18-Tisochrysis_lutea.AAC.1